MGPSHPPIQIPITTSPGKPSLSFSIPLAEFLQRSVELSLNHFRLEKCDLGGNYAPAFYICLGHFSNWVWDTVYFPWLHPRDKLLFPAVSWEANGQGCLLSVQEKRKDGKQITSRKIKLKPKTICWLPDCPVHHFRRAQLVPPLANQSFLGAGLVSVQLRE